MSASLRAAVAIFAFAAMAAVAAPKDYNALVLRTIRSMPAGGGYATNSEAATRLREAARVEGGRLVVNASGATPSYCSGATYLVLLKVFAALADAGVIQLDADTVDALTVRGQPDGAGVWGRWNANGPGTARLFYELGLGRSFTDPREARPGDFLKVFWTEAIGKAERGHLVIYLGSEYLDGIAHVRFWSSNQGHGYGEKSVPWSKVKHALFSRLENPGAIAGAPQLPPKDPYLGSLLAKASSRAEMLKMCGVKGR